MPVSKAHGRQGSMCYGFPAPRASRGKSVLGLGVESGEARG
jgi:hypothetical protein